MTKLKTILLIIALSLMIVCLIPNAEAGEIDINSIIQIESNGNPNAYNKSSGAIGLMQITPICLMDWFNNVGMFGTGYTISNDIRSDIVYADNYNMSDMYDGGKNVRVGSWYINTRIPQMLKHYGLEDTVDKPLLLEIACYNWGIGNVVKWYRSGAKYNKLPQETRRYYEKYLHLQSVQ